MGIDYFSDFIREHAPNCYFEIPLESFRHRRVAIDINNLAFAMMSVATKEVVDRTELAINKPDRGNIDRLAIDKIIGRLVIYLQHGITPVCVFDGKPHELKSHAKAKRKANNDRIKNKLKDAEIKLYSVDLLFRVQPLINEYAKYCKQNIEVSYDFMNQLRDILITVGFPVLSATDFGLETRDAEGICAALCLQGNDYCVATVSTDSDYHTYGGNIEITDIYPKYVNNNGVRVHVYYAKVRSLEAILQQCGLTFDRFRDLCILQGTDFNPNIPGVGVKRSWDYITRYGSIVGLGQSGIDISILNYFNVLKIFASTIVKINIPLPNFNVSRFREHGRNMFDLYNLRDHASSIADTLEYFIEDTIVPTVTVASSSNQSETPVDDVSHQLENSLLISTAEPTVSVINL